MRPACTGYRPIVRITGYELRALTERLGAPQLRQIARRGKREGRLLVHWGCGCTGIGETSARWREELRWARCAHHAEAFAS